MFRRIWQNIVTALYVPDPERAQRVRMYWAMGYAFVGFHLLTAMIYTTMNNKMPKTAEERKQMYQRMASGGEVHIYRIKGTNVLEVEVEQLPGLNKDAGLTSTQEQKSDTIETDTSEPIALPQHMLVTEETSKEETCS